jgi:hypothetical protein
MGLSKWEIILDELTRMGYIVKKEPDSDGNEKEIAIFHCCHWILRRFI